MKKQLGIYVGSNVTLNDCVESMSDNVHKALSNLLSASR